MDPITIIVLALATGAAAGLKPTAEKLIKDTYEGVKKAMGRALDAVTASDARGFFEHCGYRATAQLLRQML